MKKKYLIIASIIILILICGSIVINIVVDYNKETKIRNEVQEIIEELKQETIDEEKIKLLLNRQEVKKGKYNKVEISIKKYYTDIYLNISNLNFLTAKENYELYLEEDNLEQDKPNFIKSKEKLTNTNAQISIEYESFKKKTNDKATKMVYIADKGLKQYYIDFFLELTNEVEINEINKNIENQVNDIAKISDVYNEVFSFLSANKGNWDVKGNIMTFKETTLYDEYSQIIEKLPE